MAVTIRAAVVVLSFGALAITAYGQPRVDPRNMYERVMAIVPLVGKGTLNDPKRPMYAPAPTDVRPAVRTGILGYNFVESDDGKFALVEFVAKDRSAFKSILADATIKTFLKSSAKPQDIQTEFKKYKKDFDFANFGLRAQ